MLALSNILTLAQAETPAPANPLLSLLPIILIFVIMYMLLIRPQQKRNKEHLELVKRLKAGDKIITAGGIHGTITGVKEGTLMLRISDKVEIEISRGSVATIKTDNNSAA